MQINATVEFNKGMLLLRLEFTNWSLLLVSIIVTMHFDVAATLWAFSREVPGSNIGMLLSTLIEI
jgi:hypothetical protein